MGRLSDDAFLALLGEHRHELYRFVLRNVWNPSAAEDVFAGAVQVAWRQLDHFQPGSNFRAWMYRILTNKCFVANRETQRSSIDLDSIDESRFASQPNALTLAGDSPEAFLAACGDELQQAMRQLSTAERSCLLLLTCEHYSYKEIAHIMEMPVGTVMTHLARGRAKLRRLLADYARRSGIITDARAERLGSDSSVTGQNAS
jgi:RNA polymerase sigma-70 factor, ECF subfamily